ncbi:hypothetical protein Bca52824_064271 [Brassica carinata]|uniref:Uncharacterized protein n=1 Tax=Brassica carinata TaxID=52824 RepID=A0A8X7U9Z5_BRACI|nr:hypothetical protein Bca52824_064271 [Brassica carinata]
MATTTTSTANATASISTNTTTVIISAVTIPTTTATATSTMVISLVQVKLFKEVTSPLVLRKRSSIKGKTVSEAQKTFCISNANQYVEAGTYLRVHAHPKRSPRCYEIDWKSRIIAVTDSSYVILDKLAGTTNKEVNKLHRALDTVFVVRTLTV